MSEDDVPKLGDLTDKPPEGPPPSRKDLTNIRPPPKRRGNFDAQARYQDAKEFAGGFGQGAVFDPVQGIDQLIAHATDNKVGLPDNIRQWLEKYKKDFSETESGRLGQNVGMVASTFLPFSGARAPGALARAGRIGRGAAIGGAAGLAQPVEEKPGGDYAQQKALQYLSGMAGGAASGLIPTIAAAWLGHLVGKELAKSIGWGPVLGTGLGALAAHNSVYGAARSIGRFTSKPGGQFATGRVGAEAGPGFMEQIFPDIKQEDPNGN